MKALEGMNISGILGKELQQTKKDSIIVTYELPGTYNVKLLASELYACPELDSISGKILTHEIYFDVMEGADICYGEEFQINASGAVSYNWSPSNSLSNASISNPIASPNETTFYFVTMIDANGCMNKDTVLINVEPFFKVDFEYSKINDCQGEPTIVLRNTSEKSDEYLWTFGDGTISSEFEPTIKFEESDAILISLKSYRKFCEEEMIKYTSSMKTFVPNVISPNGDSKNDTFEVITDEPINLQIVNRWGNMVYEKDSYDDSFTGSALSSGVYYYEFTFQEDGTSCHGWLQILK